MTPGLTTTGDSLVPVVRPRRLRQNPAVRALVAETRLHPRELVLPVFVKEGASSPTPIVSMPGVVQHSLDSLVDEARRCVAAGVGGFVVFGVPLARDAVGSGAVDPDGILNVALRRAATWSATTWYGRSLPRRVHRPRPLRGAHPGLECRQRRHPRPDAAGLTDTIVLAYAAKYASGFYGPFREAVESSLVGDRATYQQDPANRRESLREIQLDLDEGAALGSNRR